MTLTSQTHITPAREFVRLGFWDIIDPQATFRSLEFLTQDLTTIEVQQVLPVVHQFNAFRGQAVADAIGRFRGRVMGWRFGRAGSPLLIVALAPWTHQVEDNPPGSPVGRQFSDSESKALVRELHQLFVGQLGADKFEMNGDVDYEYGAWWN